MSFWTGPNLKHLQTRKYQIIENADVAFVKGANERNEFFEKINKQ